MKLSIQECDITPLEPCWQYGYVQRDHHFEGVHDPVRAVVFVPTIAGKKLVWVSTDLTGTNQALVDAITAACGARGVTLSRENFVIGASHNHSAPSVALGSYGDTHWEASPAYWKQLVDTLADAIVEAWSREGEEVEARYASAEIDGLYSNRNDADKLSDKTVHLLGFFRGETPVGVYVTLACHNTVLGPLNYEITGELFGNIRDKLEAHFGCAVFMAQGNAGDMGNRQYRKEQTFEELERTGFHIAAQIRRKMTAWTPVELNRVLHRSMVYKAHVTLDASIYDAKIANYEEQLKTERDLTRRKVMLSGIAGFQAKKALGSGERTFEMPAEIFDFGGLQMVCVPGELASALGLPIKAASPAPHCILWGYNGACDLGYIIDREAFELECQEVNTTKYPEGVGEDYANAIIRELQSM